MKAFFLLLLLSGCSTSLKINSVGCSGNVKLMNANLSQVDKASVTWREFGIGVKEVKIEDVLNKASQLQCRGLESLRLTIARDTVDQLLSLIPFYSQWTLTLEYEGYKAK